MRVTLDIHDKYAELLTGTCIKTDPEKAPGHIVVFAADLTRGPHITINEDGNVNQSREPVPTEFKWTNTIDDLPDFFKTVLVFMPGEAPWDPVREGHFKPNGSWYAGGLERAPEEITHWAEKPAGPEVTTA